MSSEDKKELSKHLLEQQVIGQRRKFSFWISTTSQSAQIDIGYISQHLVSLVTSIPG